MQPFTRFPSRRGTEPPQTNRSEPSVVPGPSNRTLLPGLQRSRVRAHARGGRQKTKWFTRTRARARRPTKDKMIETPRERRAPDGVGMNVGLDGPGTTGGSDRFVCGGSVFLRGEKRVKVCMARIVPNYSAFRKRNRTLVAQNFARIVPVAPLPLRNSKHANLPPSLPMREHGQL
jgi:hypothetical protein